jgi:hypothetical protein
MLEAVRDWIGAVTEADSDELLETKKFKRKVGRCGTIGRQRRGPLRQ